MTPRGPQEVAADAPFALTVKEAARNAGLKSLRVFVGDREILDEADAPAVIGTEDVTLYPFDTPA